MERNGPSEDDQQRQLRIEAIAERQHRADSEPMTVRSANRQQPWSDYLVTSQRSGKTYRVALRGMSEGTSYCSCPDFRTNQLGTCKHILHVLDKVRLQFPADTLEQPYHRSGISLKVEYGAEIGVRFNLPADPSADVLSILGSSPDRLLVDPLVSVRLLDRLQKAGHDVLVYPDAEQWIDERLLQRRLSLQAAELRRDPLGHPLRRELLNLPLLPYQLDGIAFAVSAGRSILADEVGLGKTVQAIGVAELLARWAEIGKVLIVCPALLQNQWATEIERFTGRIPELVARPAQRRGGAADGRASLYRICSYERAVRDVSQLDAQAWDLLILDEAQRIKNWESKTSQAVRRLRSRFAIALTDVPFENRLEELYTIVGFVDDARLGPAYRFFHQHQLIERDGRVVGYRNLNQLRQSLKPILLRRTRADIAHQLPERFDQILRVMPSKRQQEVHDHQLAIVERIAAKRHPSEIDLVQLRAALQKCRMAAASVRLVDPDVWEQNEKLTRLSDLLESLMEGTDRKVALFTEWRGILDDVQQLCDQLDISFVRIDGRLSAAERQAMLDQFRSDPTCRLAMMTSSVAAGLDLQAADTVINMDVPASLSGFQQRSGAVHNLGQRRPIHVYTILTEETIEEPLLDSMANRQAVLDAAIDPHSQADEIDLHELAGPLQEQLLALVQPLVRRRAAAKGVVLHSPSNEKHHRFDRSHEDLAGAAGRLLMAAVQLAERLRPTGPALPDDSLVDEIQANLATACSRDDGGRIHLDVVLPDAGALREVARQLAHLARHG